jgi:RHS repeat-associated protein
MTSMLSLILALMLTMGGGAAANIGPGTAVSPVNAGNCSGLNLDVNEKPRLGEISKIRLFEPMLIAQKARIISLFRIDFEKSLLVEHYYFRARHLDPIMGRFLQVDPMGYQDSLNLYQALNMNPVNFLDPFGLYKFEPSERERDEDRGAIRAWGMENIGWDYFVMQTGHDLWNVASLGTLGRVESQENLGTWGGVFESSGNAVTRVSNTITLGLQDENYYTQMREGAGLKNIVKGTGKGLLNLTPYEEIKTIFSSDSDAGQKISSIFMGISKLASLVGLYETLKTPTNPKAQSLEDFQARKWYWKNEKLIHENIDQNLSIKSKGLEAYQERNLIRTKARELMADQKKAAELNRTNPNKTLKQAVRENYKAGYVGDELWRRIYNSAIRSRPIDDFKMRLEIIRHYLFFSGVLGQ